MFDELEEFKNAKCKPRAKSETPLKLEDVQRHITTLGSNWLLSDDEKSISRCFKFKNYYETMAFVNAAALVAHQQDHHPEITVSYNTCHIKYATHSIDGLSLNDFICAAKTDYLLTL